MGMWKKLQKSKGVSYAVNKLRGRKTGGRKQKVKISVKGFDPKLTLQDNYEKFGLLYKDSKLNIEESSHNELRDKWISNQTAE